MSFPVLGLYRATQNSFRIIVQLITYGYNIFPLHRGCWDAEVGRARGGQRIFLALRALMVDLDTELWHLA